MYLGLSSPKMVKLHGGEARYFNPLMRDSIFTAPPVTPFVECPTCKRLIEYGLDRCPSCREDIDAEYARLSATTVAINTQACGLANTIKTAEPAVGIILGASVFAFFFNHRSPLLSGFLSPIVYISAIVLWFLRYRRFRVGDEDFQRARRELVRSLKLWSALLAVQILVLAYFLRSG
jgi:hypothetical protein